MIHKRLKTHAEAVSSPQHGDDSVAHMLRNGDDVNSKSMGLLELEVTINDLLLASMEISSMVHAGIMKFLL